MQPTMLKTHALPLTLLVALTLLFIATTLYPGGTQNDRHAIGFDWRYNYLSNLFLKRALNGMDNPARLWAISGMLLLCVTFAWFFFGYSKLISSRSAARVIRFSGVGAALFSFLAVTRYHDVVITIASTLALLSMFYITVFLFRSKLHFFKFLSVLTLLIGYLCNYVYVNHDYWNWLPFMQKLTFLATTSWMLSLHYFTHAKDFQGGVAAPASAPTTHQHYGKE